MQKLAGKLAPKLLASGGARRALAEKRLFEKARHHIVEHAPGGGDFAVQVALLAEKFFGKRIDDHVARPGIEGHHLVERCGGGNGGEVRNPPDIECDAPDAAVAVEKIVEIRN